MKKSDSKKRAFRWLWGLIPWGIVVCILAFIFMMGGKIKEEQTRLAEAKEAAMKKDIPAIKVITLTLEPRRMEDMISLPGEVEPFEDLWVKAEVTGQVMRIPVKEGQYVKKGQVLARIDERDYRSRLARIEANYKLAKLDHDRIESLAKRKITAISKLDEAVARLDEMAAQLREAKLALSRTRITAPINGIFMWTWGSMHPGRTNFPFASITVSPFGIIFLEPIAIIFPSSTAIVASIVYLGNTTFPFSMIKSTIGINKSSNKIDINFSI